MPAPPQRGSLPPLSAPAAFKNTNFYSIQMNRFSAPPILQLTQNKPLLFSYSAQMNAFLAPRILQFTQNKLLRYKSLHFFYSIQMSRHKSLITNH